MKHALYMHEPRFCTFKICLLHCSAVHCCTSTVLPGPPVLTAALCHSSGGISPATERRFSRGLWADLSAPFPQLPQLFPAWVLRREAAGSWHCLQVSVTALPDGGGGGNQDLDFCVTEDKMLFCLRRTPSAAWVESSVRIDYVL